MKWWKSVTTFFMQLSERISDRYFTPIFLPQFRGFTPIFFSHFYLSVIASDSPPMFSTNFPRTIHELLNHPRECLVICSAVNIDRVTKLFLL